MQNRLPSLARHFVASFLLASLAFLTFAPRAQAITAASLTAANLSGKTLRFTITGGNAPFETSGSFTVVFGANATYTMPISDGNAAMRSGTYTVSVDAFGTVLRFAGYILNNATVEAVIIPNSSDQTASQFEMYTTGANKRGTVVFDTGTSGAPAVTSATTATATVGSPFTYTITTNPAATAFANSGGNAPVAINPTTGIVTGTFNTAGTFTFSFTASNAAGSSAVTTVTVTATAGGTGGGNVAQFAGTYSGRIGSIVNGNVNDNLTDYTVTINNTGGVTAAIGGQAASLTGTINASGVITFTSGPGLALYNLTTAFVSAGVLSSEYNAALGTSGARYRFGRSGATSAPAVPYLGNLSVRARAGSADSTLIVGVTIGGATTGTKSVLIRGVGPTLATFGVATPLADPVLTVLQGTTVLNSNDDWNNDPAIAAASVAVGGFPLPASSRDAALVGTGVIPGSYTIQLTGKAGATGNGLIELYDTTPAANITAVTPRFTNLSARTFGGTGAETLIVGFNLGGTTAKRLLVRAVGPGLSAFGLTGLMSDPKLELYSGSTKTAENDNWEAASLTTQQSVGAFNLTAGSRDAVLVSAPLAPGGYTVQVTGGTTGVVLVEVYELP